MKIAVGTALDIFMVVNNLKIDDNPELRKKLGNIWIELLPLATKWDNAILKRDKEVKAIQDKYVQELQALPAEERKAKQVEYDAKIQSEIDQLISVQAVNTMATSEEEIELTQLTLQDFRSIAQCVSPAGVALPLRKLVKQD